MSSTLLSSSLDSSSPSPSPSSFTSYLSCEFHLLVRLLYKTRNQHRRGNYYQKLQQVKRMVERVRRELDEEGEGEGEDGKKGNDAVAAASSSQQHQRRLIHSLLQAQSSILKASAILLGLLSSTYFMSFALSAYSILSRLYSLQRRRLFETIDSLSPSSLTHTPIGRIHRVIRCQEEQERTIILQAAELEEEELFQTMPGEDEDTPNEPCGSSKSIDNPSNSSRPITIDSDGDSDEEEEEGASIVAPRKRAPSLPPQLAFFQSAPTPNNSKPAPTAATAVSAKTLNQANTKQQSTLPTPTTSKNKTPTRPSPSLPSPPPATPFQTPIKHVKGIQPSTTTNNKRNNNATPSSITNNQLPNNTVDAEDEAMDQGSDGDDDDDDGEPAARPAAQSKPSAPASIAKPAATTVSVAGVKRKQPPASVTPTNSARASPASTPIPSKSKSASASPPAGALSAAKKKPRVDVAAATSTAPPAATAAKSSNQPKPSSSTSPIDLLTRGMMPIAKSNATNPPQTTQVKKKKKKAPKPASDDEMDDIFG